PPPRTRQPRTAPVSPLTPPSPTQLSTLSLHDALPISLFIHFVSGVNSQFKKLRTGVEQFGDAFACGQAPLFVLRFDGTRTHRQTDRKSTRLNSSHVSISYAVFCLKKKKVRSAKTPSRM